MIKCNSKGSYRISLDGGKSFKYGFDNLLTDLYYSKNSYTATMTMSIGTGSTPPAKTDTALEALYATSVGVNYFSGDPFMVVNQDDFTITYTQLFDFGTGHTATISEMGLNNPNLVSRSLVRDLSGNPTTVSLLVTDHVVIEYAFTYVIPSTDIPIVATIDGLPVNGTVKIVNPANWGSNTLGKTIEYDKIGFGDLGDWVVNPDKSISGANPINSADMGDTLSKIGSDLVHTGTAFISTNEHNIQFQQILVIKSSIAYTNATMLIEFDSIINKTSSFSIDLSIQVKQEPTA